MENKTNTKLIYFNKTVFQNVGEIFVWDWKHIAVSPAQNAYPLRPIIYHCGAILSN